MPEIGNSIYLLAALGIVVPVIIHLWNRKPPQVVEVGSIRWLKGSNTRSARRLQPEQWPLLLLRCLMLLLFSLLLAGLFWETTPMEERKGRLYLIHAQRLQGLGEPEIDSLLEKGFRPRLLAPGLPLLADSLRWQNRPVDVWAVLREADKAGAFSDSVLVSTPLLQAYFSGERPRLHKTYTFVEADYPQETEIVYSEAVRQEEMVILQQAVSATERVWLRKDSIPHHEWTERKKEVSVDAKDPSVLKVSILASEAFARDVTIIRYAVEAAASMDPSLSLLLNTQSEEAAGNSDLLFWLGKGAIPPQLQAEAAVVVAYDSLDKSGWEWLVQDYSKPREAIYYLSERPLPERVSREKLSRLPLELAKVLPDKRQEELSQYLAMPVQQALPLKAAAETGGDDPEAEQRDLHVYVWLLLFCLFVIERIWVYRS